MKQIYEELKERSLPLIKHYHNDLLIHDKDHLDAFPGRPFLHFTGETGTHIVTFFNLEDYPAHGKRVPYLFGTATRDHILSQTREMVNAMERVNRMDLIQYFDGTKLEAISYQLAKSLTENYIDKMRTEFRKA